VSDTYNKQSAFQPVGFTIPKEVSNHEDRQDEQNDHEDLKVQVQGFADGPGDEDD
jgi:hypothetical protein